MAVVSFSTLLGSLRLSLRDPNSTTWNDAQLGELINRGIDAVSDVYSSEIIESVSFTQPDVGLIFSTTLSSVVWPIRVDIYDTGGRYRETVRPSTGDGPDSGWEVHGGILYLPTRYVLPASTGTMNVVGYGNWNQISPTFTTANVAISSATVTTNLDVTATNAVKIYVEAEALTMLTFDRAQYQQWQVSSGSSDISALGMNNLAMAAQSRWRQEKNRIRRLRKGG